MWVTDKNLLRSGKNASTSTFRHRGAVACVIGSACAKTSISTTISGLVSGLHAMRPAYLCNPSLFSLRDLLSLFEFSHLVPPCSIQMSIVYNDWLGGFAVQQSPISPMSSATRSKVSANCPTAPLSGQGREVPRPRLHLQGMLLQRLWASMVVVWWLWRWH